MMNRLFLSGTLSRGLLLRNFSTESSKKTKEYVIKIKGPNIGKHYSNYLACLHYPLDHLNWQDKKEKKRKEKEKFEEPEPKKPPSWDFMCNIWYGTCILTGGYLAGRVYYKEKTQYSDGKVNLGFLTVSLAIGALGGTVAGWMTHLFWPILLPSAAIFIPLFKIEFYPQNFKKKLLK